MPVSSRQAGTGKGNSAGPFLAKVVSHLDPSYMGALEVTLLKNQGNEVNNETQTHIVKFASPFYGVTAYTHMGENQEDYNDTQKAYGMWFVPPDVGVTVLVVFIEGDPARGYWIGCIADRFANHMVPAIAASDAVAISGENKKKYDTKFLPVAEVNRKAMKIEEGADINKAKKPVHPIADRFLEQGLLEDDVHGIVKSSARREVPNMVFGISTPGPIDQRPGAKKEIIGKKGSKTPSPVNVSRLGGTQFVMDDGDITLVRKTHPSVGKMEYANILKKEKGDPTIPYSEYFRVRTRTGHQILMHNSEDLIYIGNSRGTAWVELSSDGKIDIFASDSISVHTKNDLNFYADRDINFEAGRNINMKASAQYSNGKEKDANGSNSGRIQIESKFNCNLHIGKDGKITVVENFEINTQKNNRFTAVQSTHIKSGAQHIETAPQIHMNGPTAETATKVVKLPTHKVKVTDVSAGWKKRYQVDKELETIMKRVPMHEPWKSHEHLDPTLCKPAKTDREKK